METADVTVYVAEVEDAIWDGHRKPPSTNNGPHRLCTSLASSRRLRASASTSPSVLGKCRPASRVALHGHRPGVNSDPCKICGTREIVSAVDYGAPSRCRSRGRVGSTRSATGSALFQPSHQSRGDRLLNRAAMRRAIASVARTDDAIANRQPSYMRYGKADPGYNCRRHCPSPVAQGSEDEAPEEEPSPSGTAAATITRTSNACDALSSAANRSVMFGPSSPREYVDPCCGEECSGDRRADAPGSSGHKRRRTNQRSGAFVSGNFLLGDQKGSQ